jgi:hypothetical protein
VAACLSGLALPPAAAQAPESPTPNAIQADIAAYGPAAAVASLTRDGTQLGTPWGWAMIGIGTGAPDWLHVAALLRRGTDAATTPALLDALSTALRRNAAGVLALTGRTIRPEDICRPRLADPRPIDLRVFQVHTQDAVAAVTRPDLRAARDRCLVVLAASEKDR